jgi:hypothetical protein
MYSYFRIVVPLSPTVAHAEAHLCKVRNTCTKSVRTANGLQIEQVQGHVREDSQISGISTKPPLPV